MTKLILAPVVVVAFMLTGQGTESASAGDFAIHFAGPGYHFDIGRSHGHGRHHRVRRDYGHHGHHGHRDHGHHGWGGRHAWHDTTHLDYHPGGFVPHYDHYDYVPSHYHLHRDGHWDHYGW